MIHNNENPASISYVSVYSDPNRVNEVMDEGDTRLTRYCRCLEIAVMVCEILTAASLVICAISI